MPTVWMALLKFALSVAMTAVSQIPASQWATLGTVINTWLKTLSDKLPAGHPATSAFSSFRAPAHKLDAAKPDK